MIETVCKPEREGIIGKEVTKERPMSDTLLEPEDQTDEHQVTKSGICVVPGCPCRGWSAQEIAIRDYPVSKTTTEFDMRSDEHQPAARGGGEEWVFNAKIDGQFHIRSKEDYNGDCVAHTDTKPRAEQICREHNQHQSLVAERERLITALQDCIQSLSRLPDVDGAYRQTTLKSTGRLLAEIELNALNQQRSTSE